MNDLNWVKTLKDIQEGINLKEKRSLDNMSPLQIVMSDENAQKLKKFNALKVIEQERKYGKKRYDPEKDHLRVGDSVRVIVPRRNIFSKVYEPTMSPEIYSIVKIIDSAPPRYLLNDSKLRPHYAHELSRTHPEEKQRKKDLFISSSKKVEGRKLRSGNKSNQEVLYLLKSRQSNTKPRYINQLEKDRLEAKGLL